MRFRRFALLALTLAVPASAHAADATYVTSLLPKSGPRQEPRIAVAPNDVRYADAIDVDGNHRVWASRDGGQTWQSTEGLPPQESATIDVDIVTLPSGRIVASELDDAGLNFPTGYSDDGGKTWHQSVGANTLADQDRQWFAVGPVPKGSPAGTQAPVYLLYHNLASGVAQHNMWVAKSTDGGATFQPPVPIATPESDAYRDLQCSDSGGPSNITVNPTTGRIYAFYTTRAAPNPSGQDAGGCAAPVFGQPIEFNIVNGTRVWVASSKDGSLGSWSNSLAVDDAATGQVVSMQLAYGALDNAGNVYVAYPESPNPYPDLEGAAVKLVWQKPDADGNLTDKGWSKPATLVDAVPHKAGTPAADPTGTATPAEKIGGADLVHLVAGDPGKIAVAYYYGDIAPGSAGATPYYTHILQSFDAQSPTPHVSDFKVDIPAYKWTTSKMMGLCDTAQKVPVFGGVVAGLGCSRSTDVWGIALDSQCRVMAVWPTNITQTKGLPNAQDGTWVTTQTDGPTLCSKPSAAPGGSQGVVFQPTTQASSGTVSPPGCRDRIRPTSRVKGKVRITRTSFKAHGTAIDRGCGVKGKRARARVRSVAVAIAKVYGDNRCRFVRGDGSLGATRNCKHPTFIAADGTSKWSVSVKGTFAKGHYFVWSRAIDVVGNRQLKSKRHLRHVRV